MNRLSVPSRTVCFDSDLITQQAAIFYSSTYCNFSLLKCKAESGSLAYFCAAEAQDLEFPNHENLAKLRFNKSNDKT